MVTQDLDVAILTNNLHHAARDKQCCAKLNVKSATVFESLEEVLPPLRSKAYQLLLIDTALKGKSGCDSLKAIRKATRDQMLPAVMVSTDSSLRHVLAAIAAGCNGYVIRPYSPSTLERHVLMAIASTGREEIEYEQLSMATDLVQQGRFDEAIEEFTEIVEEPNEALRYFNQGMDYLHRQKFGKAILAFNKAVAANALFAEAYKGLALAHKGKGDEAGYRAYLDKSAEILAIQDRLDELKALFADILQANPEAVNPYNTLGINLRRKGDYGGALHAYTQALELTPTDENLHYNIAKACLFAKDYDRAMGHLEQAVALRPGFDEAKALLGKLRDKNYDQLAAPVAAPSRTADQEGLDIDL